MWEPWLLLLPQRRFRIGIGKTNAKPDISSPIEELKVCRPTLNTVMKLFNDGVVYTNPLDCVD